MRELLDGGEAAAVGGDVGVGLFLGDFEDLGEAEAGLAVDDAEVDGLGDGAHIRGDLVLGDGVEFGGDHAVDVAVGGEGFEEGGFAAVVGQHAEFDLGVVGGDEDVAGGGDEARRISRPSSVLTGMFWRLGSEEERRPVSATVWLKWAWTRPPPPVRGLGSFERVSR